MNQVRESIVDRLARRELEVKGVNSPVVLFHMLIEDVREGYRGVAYSIVSDLVKGGEDSKKILNSMQAKYGVHLDRLFEYLLDPWRRTLLYVLGELYVAHPELQGPVNEIKEEM